MKTRLLTMVAVTYGATTLPRRRLNAKVWTISSSWRWRCTSWASRGSSRREQDLNTYSRMGVVERDVTYRLAIL